MRSEKITAIILAGGSGKRMGTACKKQYMLLGGRPLLFYALRAFEESCVDEIVLVTNEEAYCRRELVEQYGFGKVTRIVPGGAERYDSVYAGLLAAEGSGYVLIHDGARPFLTQELIDTAIEGAKKYLACAVGMPVKDTIKIADEDGFAVQTPRRDLVWQIQTPQAFSYPLILKAYEHVRERMPEGITDDAMVVEYGGYARVKLLRGSYRNLKVTTPEDMVLAEGFLKDWQCADGRTVSN